MTAEGIFSTTIEYMLDRAEKVVPSITPENLKDIHPAMRNYEYNY